MLMHQLGANGSVSAIGLVVWVCQISIPLIARRVSPRFTQRSMLGLHYWIRYGMGHNELLLHEAPLDGGEKMMLLSNLGHYALGRQLHRLMDVLRR